VVHSPFHRFRNPDHHRTVMVGDRIIPTKGSHFVANHRAERPNQPHRRQPVTVPIQAKRDPNGHLGARKRLFRGLPSTLTFVGVVAVALAAAGAVTMSQTGVDSKLASGNLQKLSAQANVLNGASSVGSSDALSGRVRAASRDSQREALQSAADQQLQAAAEAQAKQRNAALAGLAASAEQHANQMARNVWGLPIPHGGYHLTARFGDISGLWSHAHTGLDFAAPTGTPIHAVATGVITGVGWAGAYGNRTIETLPDGTELWYAHQNAFAVTEGQHVTEGEVIGYVGATGNVTGPHVHLEVRPGAGDPVDPFAALVAHGVQP
jgi:murein DD-endopeptidase MepM/ murein hydrolase activator NlpD